MRGPLRIFNLCGKGLTRYRGGLAWQDVLAAQRKAGAAPDSLLLLQHHPVYTLGKRGQEQDFKLPMKDLMGRGIDIEVTPRGGEVTYHGPGQLVAYPVLNLRELGLGARAYVEGLEDCILRFLARFHVRGRGRVPGATGIWVGDSKIAAIGVKISHGISSHGFALNVGGPTLLPAFEAIVPCGIQDERLGVTSLEAQLQEASALHREQPASQFQSQGTVPAAQMCSINEAQKHHELLGTDAALSVVHVSQLLEQDFAEHFGYQEVMRLTHPPAERISPDSVQ